MKYECEICAGDFSKSKIIECGYCNLKACRDCNKTYLLSRTDEIHCMGCRNKWNLEFCHKNLTKKFINGEYKRHQTELLFQTEKSRFPETMPLVEDYLEIKRKRTELAEIKREERELAKKLREVRNKKYKLDREIFDLEVWGNRKEKPNEEKRVFIRPCSVNGCRGFLSTKWKCGVCQEYTCSKCFETKDENHVCHEDNLKSAEMIRRETRNCPSCGVNIFKISGCDQMWCVKCQVAFSWNTGLRVTGVVHNPHYYEWRRNGGQAIRNAGELHCGGIPDFRRYESKIYKDKEVPNSVIYGFPYNFPKDNNREYFVPSTYTTYQKMLEDVHRAVLHFQDIILTRQRRECNGLIDNQKMRIEYLANDLSEEKMKKKLIQKKIQENRNRAILDVYELLNTVWTESMLQIYNNLSVKTVQDEIQRMTQVTILANRELIKISQMYNTRVIVFAHNFLNCLDSPRTFTKKYIKEIEDGTRSHQYVRKELNFGKIPPPYPYNE